MTTDETDDLKRLSININEPTQEALRRLKRETTAGTATEVVRRAIGYSLYLHDAVKSGSTVIVRDSRGREKEIVLL